MRYSALWWSHLFLSCFSLYTAIDLRSLKEKGIETDIWNKLSFYVISLDNWLGRDPLRDLWPFETAQFNLYTARQSLSSHVNTHAKDGLGSLLIAPSCLQRLSIDNAPQNLRFLPPGHAHWYFATTATGGIALVIIVLMDRELAISNWRHFALDENAGATGDVRPSVLCGRNKLSVRL